MAKIPKNIRQVGKPGNNLTIYIEDYVYTYLKSEYGFEAAILTGESLYEEEGVKILVRGAITCPQLQFKESGMELTPRTWNYIYRELEQAYNGQEVVGWYVPIPSEEEEKNLIAAGEFHGRHFPGIDKTFFYRSQKSGDESFYVRDGQVFKRQPGYYIFYEKNTPMREYMLARREERQLEEDLRKEVHEQPRERIRYREMINEEIDKSRNNMNALSYGLSVFAVIGVLALTLGVISGYQEVNDMENVLGTLGEMMNAQNNEMPLEEEEDDVLQETEAEEDGEEIEVEEEPEPEETPTDGDAEAALALAQGYYIVEQGESLASISRKIYGTDEKIEEICEANGITDPDTIYPGQTLYLP